LLVEALAGAVAAAAGARVQLFGPPVDYVITVIWIVLITNAFNLLDNMDAAVASIVPIIAAGLAITALLEGQRLVGGLAVVVAAASLAFLVYNWHPARIFLGDAGSLFMGFLLAVISLKLRTGVPHEASAIAVVLLVGPAVFDTTLVVISRVRTGRKIFIGGTDHTSHRLMLLGVPHVGVTAILVAATALSVGLGVLVAEGLVAPAVALPVALVAGGLALGFLLRVGVYHSEAGSRTELFIKSRVGVDDESSTPKANAKWSDAFPTADPRRSASTQSRGRRQAISTPLIAVVNALKASKSRG
ncbi:MAG: MraY family glycosyltransferase, partial [Mycobacterium sp.]